ncbi:MAG: four helix bundle protein [Povalibacter sp.]
MDPISTHKDLIVWQKSVELASKVYAATAGLPSTEHDALQQQLRQSAVEVASSIAEGAACRRRGEFLKFLQVARSSLIEMETRVLIAKHHGLAAQSAPLLDDISELEKLLNALMRRLADTTRQAHARSCALEISALPARRITEVPR